MDDEFDWTLVDFTDERRPGSPQNVLSHRPTDVFATKRMPGETLSAAKGGCPKCGKVLGRGGHFHVKHCKGA